MVKIVSTNITSPIGATTEQNYQAYIHDVSALACYGSDKPYVVSLFTDEQREQMAVDGFSSFESLVIRSVQEALSHLNIDITDNRTLFILSTTKANVAELSADGADDRAMLASRVFQLRLSLCVCLKQECMTRLLSAVPTSYLSS